MIPLHDNNPTSKTPVITITFIAACVLVFLYQVSNDLQLIAYRYGAIPSLLFGHGTPEEIPLSNRTSVTLAQIGAPAVSPSLTVLTSMFLHGGPIHLIGNMLYLWIFGNNIEDVMGRLRFIGFYIACGILAALSHAITDPHSTVPMIGASGAISGVLGAYLLLFPRAQVLVVLPLGILSRIFYVPAFVVLGLWFVLQLVSGGMSKGGDGGGVAFFAHIGGFIAGMALIGLFKDKEVPFFAGPQHRPQW